MGRTSNVYSKVDEADEVIKKLCEMQSAVLWAVKPETVTVMAIENKERGKNNNTLAKIKAVRGTEKAIYNLNKIPYRYVIECYWSDWHKWSEKERAAILFHELLHVHPEGEKTVRHDTEDFAIMLDKLGVRWHNKGEALPDLTRDKVEFDLELLPKIKELEEEDGEDNIDEREKNKEIKEAKKDTDEETKAQRKKRMAKESEDEDVPDVLAEKTE